MHAHRLSLHSLDNHLNRCREEYGKVVNNRILRLKYACNIIDEKEFKRILFAQHRNLQFVKASLDIWELLNTLTIERINNLVKDEVDIDKLIANLQEIEAIRIYFNREIIILLLEMET